LLGTTFFVLIQHLIEQGKQDAWLMPWWAGAFGMVVALLWILLHRHYPGKSLAQIPMAVLGRPLGIVIAMLYFLHFCLLAGWVLRDLSDFLNGTIMPETPMSVFHAMFLLVATYTVAQGVETIARMNQAITPFLVFPFWLVLLLATNDWDWGRFQPVLHTDIRQTMLGSHPFLAFPYMEGLVLMMLYPFVKKGAGGSLVLGIVTASLSLSLTLFMIIGLLGVERASKLAFPVYTVVKEVTLGETIVNVHSIISVILLILIFIKLLVLLFGAYESLNQAFRPKTKWPILIALFLLLTALASSIHENPIQDGEWISKYLFIYDGFFALVIPGLLLATIWFKKIFNKVRGVSGG
jgi:spore germination protein KB